MIGYLVRTGLRAAARSGPAPQPKKEAGPAGQALGGIVFLGGWVAWGIYWPPALCALIGFSAASAVVVAVHWPRSKPQRDPLEDAMRNYGTRDKS